jgi:hypothetical protein
LLLDLLHELIVDDSDFCGHGVVSLLDYFLYEGLYATGSDPLGVCLEFKVPIDAKSTKQSCLVLFADAIIAQVDRAKRSVFGYSILKD